MFGDEYKQCLKRVERGSVEQCPSPYDHCPPAPDLTPHALLRPGTSKKTYNYVLKPIAPYPPGGAPTGGDPNLRLTPEEVAELYMRSERYKCQVKTDIKHASRLDVDWKFWAGLGAGALGFVLLVAAKR